MSFHYGESQPLFLSQKAAWNYLDVRALQNNLNILTCFPKTVAKYQGIRSGKVKDAAVIR